MSATKWLRLGTDRKDFYLTTPKKHLSFFSILALTLLVPSLSWSQAPGLKIIEGAKKEGVVVWYTTMNLSSAKEFVNRFHKKYLFIKPIPAA